MNNYYWVMPKSGGWEIAEKLKTGVWRRFGFSSFWTDSDFLEINETRLIAPDECTVFTQEDMEYGKKLAMQNEYDPFCEPIPDKLPKYQGYIDPHPEHKMD